MKLHYNYLKIKAETAEKTAALLTAHTQEVDEVVHRGVLASGVIAGKILSVEKHPNADRLRVMKVDIGTKTITIVTGAPNVAEGHVMAFAVPGAEVVQVDHHSENAVIDKTKRMTIKTSPLRGIDSEGMVCGADELGLTDTSAMEALILPPDTKPGTKLEELYPTGDVIVTDDKGTAHRPDLLSYRGIELELAAILNTPYPFTKPLVPKEIRANDFSVIVEDHKQTPLFLVARLEDLQNNTSPDWLQEFLRAHDTKIINLPTDITNYLLLLEGQPTHAFDARSLEDGLMRVRFAKKGEKVATLDHKTHLLDESDLVIANSTEPLDIAGVIGGVESATKEDTKSVVLVCEVFNPTTIRKTSRRHTIRTEAASRFERGTTTGNAIHTFASAIELLTTLGKGTVTAQYVLGDTTIKQQTLSCSTQQVSQFLGFDLESKKILEVLRSLGYEVTEQNSKLTIKSPWWRSDIHGTQDVFEDIARIIGYDKIPTVTPQLKNTHIKPNYLSLISTIRRAASTTMYEVQTSSMVNRGSETSVEIQNPIGDNKFIRQSILPELFALTKQNIREGYDEYGCFEITNTYRKNNATVEEKFRFAACIACDPEAAKSSIGLILHRLHIDTTKVVFEECDQSEERSITYDAVAHIILGKTKIGSMCIEHHRGKTLCGFKLYIEELAKAANANPVVVEYSKYPSTKRDIAFVIDRSVNLGDIAHLLNRADSLITSVELFDQFSGKGMADTMRSLAFHLNFQSQDRTLTTAEVDAIMKKIEQQLQTKYKAEIR